MESTIASPDRSWRRALPLALGLVVALAFLAQPLSHPTRTGSTDDWRWFTFHWEVSRTTLLEYGELPVWNPYHCGGNVHLANPQDQFLSPLAWPALLLGVPLGLKLFLLVHLLLGYGGLYWLARDLGLGRWPAAFAASLFAGSGFFFMHVGGGHSAFLPFCFMPAALAAFRRSIAEVRWVAAVAGILALIVLEGGVYPAPYTGLLLTAYAVGRLIRAPRDHRPLTRLLLVAGLGGLLAGVKLWPVLEFLREQPRVVPSDDGMSLWEVVLAFTSRRLERQFPGHVYVWPEYGAYLGWAVVGLVAALAWRRGRAWLGWLVLTGFFVLLMTGNRGGGLAPHEVLRDLPILRSLHVPSRFGVVVTLLLALLAGAALHEWLAALPTLGLRPGLARGLRWVTALGALAILVDLLTFGQWQMSRFKDEPVRKPAEAEFRLTRTHWNEAASFPRRRIGTTACYEPNGVPRGKVRTEPGAPVFWAGGAAGALRIERWSPSRVAVAAQLTQAGLLVLNQNDHRGWQIRGAALTQRTSQDGLPAVRLAPGAHQVEFSYQPPGLVGGLLATGLGGLLTLGLLVGFTPARRRRWGAWWAARLRAPEGRLASPARAGTGPEAGAHPFEENPAS